MAKAQEAEPNERAAPSPRRPRRQHVINLCCAQSVNRVVEDAARNLEGLGFQVAVVCGAEARAALLGSSTDSNQPTIHVVCVQGSMQERVLKPLRQALATHGGPNHHLFVAVLDLEVPLAMVGQIRRFAEGLEGPGSSVGGEGLPHGAGAEHAAHRDLELVPTRTYPSVTQVPERPGTKPPVDDGDDKPRRSRSLGSRGRAAKVAPTSKYQAITANHPIVPQQNDAGVRKRRRERSRLSTASPPLARPSARRGGPAPSSRVLGLPKDVIRDDSGPLPRREPSPPPPPAGELRHSSTTVPVVSSSAPPPPPPRAPLLPKSESGSASASEPDRLQPRPDEGFRFTPPGVEQAEVRPPRGGAVTRIPLADVLSDADRTVVHGVLQEVPRTASTLRLDEPPFKAGATMARGLGDAHESSDDEPVEPTMIIAAPTSASAAGSSDSPGMPRVEPEEDFKPRKTILYADSVGVPAASSAAAPVPDAPVPDAPVLDAPVLDAPVPKVDDSAPAVSSEARRVQGAPGGEARPAQASKDESPGGRRSVPSAVPTEQHAAVPAPATAATERRASRRRPGPEAAPPTAAPRRASSRSSSSSYGWLWILLILLTVGGGWGAFEAGLFDGVFGRKRSDDTKIAEASGPKPGDGELEALDTAPPADDGSAATSALAAGVGSEPAGLASDEDTQGSTGGAEPADAGSTGGAEPADAGSTGDTGTPEPESAGSTGGSIPEPVAGSTGTNDDGADDGADDGDDTNAADDGAPDPSVPDNGPVAQLSPEEQLLGAAVDERRVFMLKTLFTTKQQGTATTFAGGWQRCAKLEVDGVKGWRLPHRREMKLVNAVLALPSGIYWTRTVPDDDKQAAYVLDSATGGLSLFLKQEPTGEVVCVRRREFPDR